nr:T9SS type A sorting domain-containing protein [Flavobacteriales bacterium]
AKTYGGTGSEEAFSCATDGYGNVFISGNYSSTSVTFDGVVMTNPGSNAGAFLLKLNPSLTAIWARGFSSSDNDEARGCSADSYGNSVVTGVFSGNSLTIGNTTLSNNGGDEIFVAKYDPNGNLFWAKKIGKSNDDGSNDCAIIDNGKVIIAGYYNSSSLTLGTIDLDNSYFGVATSDVFIGRMCEATTGTHTVSACSDYTWVDGNTYTSNTNSPIFSFPNGASCDSIVTLNLTLNLVDTSVTNVSPTLIANSSSASYQWLDCDNNYSVLIGETTQIYTATTDGNYAVEITENTCVDTSFCFTLDVITVGMEENSNTSRLQIYPNPTLGELTVQLGGLPQDVTLTVRNVLGETVSTNRHSNFKSTQIQLTSEVGVYIIELLTPTELFVTRALKL